MKKVIFILLILNISLYVYSQTGWFSLNSGTLLTLNSIQFVDGNTGYICGGTQYFGPGIARKTTDGGNVWFTILNNANELKGLYFINALTGTIVGNSVIARTTNGGTTWSMQTWPGTANYFLNVNFINSNAGVITGDNSAGLILYTSNGGSTWLNRSIGTDATWFDAQLFDANTFIVGGDGFAKVMKTTDTGLTWTYYYFSGTCTAISFLDINFGMLSGISYNNIGKTTNGGVNWSLQTISNIYFTDIICLDLSTAYSVGNNGSIYKSSDGGNNWNQQTSGTTRKLNKVSFLNLNTGWACGDTGVLVKTTNGGITFIQPISNEIPNEFSLSQNYPNPFNPTTKIKFDIPPFTKGGFITLKVFDILGKEVKTLVNESLQPGVYETQLDASDMASGVYYYKLTSGDFSESKKLILLK